MAITFFYREDRLALLAKIASVASSYAKHTDVFFIQIPNYFKAQTTQTADSEKSRSLHFLNK